MLQIITIIGMKDSQSKNMNKMKVLYTRVSTSEQNTDRQRISEKDFSLVIEDKCSGAIPFFERQGGKEILNYIDFKVCRIIILHTFLL
jgi:predicted site-specific integrase-resolvase